MRIRKRDVPLPLSSLSPIPLSDPLFLPPVQLPTAKPSPRPVPSSTNHSDLLLPKGELVADYSPELRDGKGRRGVVVVWEKSIIIHCNHSRDPDNAEKSTSRSSPPLSFEANTMALKKRRLSSSGEADGDNNKTETKTKASSNNGRRGGVGGGGGASMEGSRCSRVNGRGWRCGQQTLVGYSLCEHHLGKGRLRSMTNVRNRSMIGTREASGKGHDKPEEGMNQPTSIDPGPSLPWGMKEGNTLTYNNEGEDEDEEEEEESTANGKKKARSMSSLLGQSLNHGDQDL